MKRLINKILKPFHYHLSKFPKPYTKKKKQPKLPGIENVEKWEDPR